jgi:hypothetical protein
MQRPTESCSTSMRHPEPAMAGPPMMQSSGTNTSRPWTGPFWKGMLSGKCRRPMLTPGVLRGMSAQVMPMSVFSPSSRSGSNMRKASPMTVATGASVM